MAKPALVLIVSIGLLLSACGPRIIGATDSSITFGDIKTGWMSNNLDKATNEAVAHCNQYNKSAQLQTVDKGNAVFHCVPRQP